jgi:hypothetical protein
MEIMKKFSLVLLVFFAIVGNAAAKEDAGADDHNRFLNQRIVLTGHATNVTVNKTAKISFVISSGRDSGYRAVGGFDSETLFGQFDLPGTPYDCNQLSFLCLRFVGSLVLSKDNSGFVDGTSSDFIIDIKIDPKTHTADGNYKIGEIPPNWFLEQNGILRLVFRLEDIEYENAR